MLRTLRFTLGLTGGAALALFPAVVCAQSSAGADAAAQVRFRRGREAFIAHAYDRALVDFRAANELVRSPNTRLYIARCLRELGHVAEAFVEFTRAADEATDRAVSDRRYVATRDTARTEGAALEPRIGRLTVHVLDAPDGTEVTVAGTTVPGAGWDVPTPTDPGAVEVIARAPGRREFRQTVQLAPGGEASVTVALAREAPALVSTATAVLPPFSAEPAAPERVRVGGGVRIAGVVVLGVGAAGGAVFGAFAYLAQKRFTELSMQCMDRCGSECDADIAQGQTYQWVANVGLGVGVAGIVAGTIMVLGGGPREVDRAVTAWGAPAYGGRGGVAGIRVSF